MAQFHIRPFSDGGFPELDLLESLIRQAGPQLRTDVVCDVRVDGERLPVHCLELGSTSPDVPAIGFFGGIHGVERIGAQVLIAFLQTLVERLQWDQSLHDLLEKIRIVLVPIVNPGGMRRRTRANPAGVDLMRNAPVEADHDVSMLLGGQRLSRLLPWYRGRASAPMQPEALAVCEVVEHRLLRHRFSLSLDCHSGFGAIDRIWFPYARTRQPIDNLADIFALRSLFRRTHPYHSIYRIEPQAHQYTTHGDLWDYLYDRNRKTSARAFIPLTLEMGSWLWVKKSPAQAFSVLGMFNPIAPHRHQRILRTHHTLFDFLIRATISHQHWLPVAASRQAMFEAAIAHWYGPEHLNKDAALAR